MPEPGEGAHKEDVPLISFEAASSAPILRYDIPSPSSFEGRTYIETDIPEELFDGKSAGEKAYKKPTLQEFFDANQDSIREYLLRISKEDLERELVSFGLDKIDNPSTTNPIVSKAAIATKAAVSQILLAQEAFDQTRLAVAPLSLVKSVRTEDTIETRYKVFKYRVNMAYDVDNKYPSFYRTMGDKLKLRFVQMPIQAQPRLFLIETFRLTTYPGDYGAGTVIKTFSLIPSEETEISIRTWKRSTESAKEASSILDSYTDEKADEFERSAQSENSSSSKVEKSFSYHVEAEAKASWGWGSAKVSGGVSGSTKSAREESSKNVMAATEKHAQKASAKREVNVDTSYERTADQGQEESITRRIRNLNASRTLNFAFIQMNQEFHTLLHLVDVRVAIFNGYPGSMKEYSLYELPDLVSSFMKASAQVAGTTVKTVGHIEDLLLGEYGPKSVLDYQANAQQLIEKTMIPGPRRGETISYLRVIPPHSDSEGIQVGRQKYVIREERKGDEGNTMQAKDARYIDGIIISARKITMRTDGLVVESILGMAPALDAYALKTQVEVLRSKKLENDRVQAGLDLVAKLVGDGKVDEAIKAFRDFFGPPGKLTHKLDYVTAVE